MRCLVRAPHVRDVARSLEMQRIREQYTEEEMTKFKKTGKVLAVRGMRRCASLRGRRAH